MIQTRNISVDDLPAVKALWGQLHAQAMNNNCWPAVPNDRWFAHLRENNQWAIAEEGKKAVGFSFWKLDPDGNASVRAIAALEELPYLHLMISILQTANQYGYGFLQRSRPEWTWLANIGATFEPVGFAPMTPAEEARYATRAEKLATRVPIQDRVIVPVSLIPVIEERIRTTQRA
ncbi:MAG: hypothetical protein JW849_00830 [Phycisphaerae bacterium]|nr:hypothetical protein [Phycisphaerae bacterium]